MPTELNEEDMSPQESLRLIGKMIDKVQDEALLKVAKKRAAAKMSLVIYLVINAFLVGLWIVTTGTRSYFWPMWPMIGWGLAITFQFVDAFVTNGIFSEDREFERLKQKEREKNNK